MIQLLITVYQWIMSFGYTSYVLRMARNEQPNCWNLLDGFRTIGRAFLVYLLIYIFTTLWSLLFLVPAFIVMLVSALGGPMLMFLALLLVIAGAILSVIVTYRYRLAVYFLLDNPEMGALAAITESKRAMVGWKGELFGLEGRAVHPGSVLPGLVASAQPCLAAGVLPGLDLWARRWGPAVLSYREDRIAVVQPLHLGYRGQLLRLGGAWPLLAALMPAIKVPTAISESNKHPGPPFGGPGCLYSGKGRSGRMISAPTGQAVLAPGDTPSVGRGILDAPGRGGRKPALTPGRRRERRW